MKKVHNKQKGFTLIEILIAITIFSLLTITIASSYINIAGSQREANAIREMYSQIRYVYSLIGDEARSKTIDYGCPKQPGVNEGSNSETCPQLQLAAANSYLALINGDATERTVFLVQDNNEGDGKTLSFKKEVKGTNDEAWRSEVGFETGFVEIEMQDLRIKNMTFEKAPLADPFDPDNIACGVVQFQPSVSVYLSIESENETVSDFEMDLQTTFSSRVYNQQTNNL